MVDFVEPQKEKPRKKKKFSFKRLFIIMIFFFILSSIISSVMFSLTPKIAVIPIHGVILVDKDTSIFGDNSLSSREIASTLYSLKDDTSVEAILLDINSPGGSAVASEEIAQAVQAVKQEKPVYAVISDVGASGAYWVASSADKIYSSKLSLVGSIGVTMASLSYENLLKEYNITYRQLISGKYKDIGTPYREMSEEEKQLLQEILDQTHTEFISIVAEQRNLTMEEITPYAQGQIFLGSKAQEIGFVDKIGTYTDALTDLKNATNPSAIDVVYGLPKTFFEELGMQSPSILPQTRTGIDFKY
jgi:protease-4